MHFDFCSRRSAAADCHVAQVLQLNQKDRHCFNGHGEIGVGEKDVVSASLQDAFSNRGSFPALQPLLDDLQFGAITESFANEGHCIIAASVVDDDNLEAATLVRCKTERFAPNFCRSAALR